MFLNLTLAQQMFFFFLALFLIQLVFCILVKLKLMPVLIYLACANLIFPEWVAAHQLLYRAILAGLVLITVFRWVGPKLIEHLEEKRPSWNRAGGQRLWATGRTRSALKSKTVCPTLKSINKQEMNSRFLLLLRKLPSI